MPSDSGSSLKKTKDEKKMDSYKAVIKDGDAVIEVKRSKFIAAVRPVKSEEDALLFLESERKKYYDAKHHCSAYIIKNSPQDIVHSSDDGEPSGTAGKPIMEVISQAGLKDVICVVTRYFGGTLLGTGGLVRAYTDAAKEALEKAEIKEMTLKQEFELIFDYTHTGKVDNILKNAGCIRKDAQYSDIVRYTCSIGTDDADEVIAKVIEASAGAVKIDKKGQSWD